MPLTLGKIGRTAVLALRASGYAALPLADGASYAQV